MSLDGSSALDTVARAILALDLTVPFGEGARSGRDETSDDIERDETGRTRHVDV
jgi:hypothetical protein